jgi:hypothetical protein
MSQVSLRGKLAQQAAERGFPARNRAGKRQKAEGELVNDTYPEDLDDLVRHVAASTGLPEATATRVVADVKAYFSETVEAYVRRRHAELKDKNWKNDEIWPLLAAELDARRFGAPMLTQRQLRRMVYG